MKGEKGFDDAQKDMQEAEGDLDGDQGAGQEGKNGQDGKSGQDGQGGLDGQRGAKPRGKSGKGAAVDAQGRALEALREGAQGMQKQMSQGQGQGEGKGKGYTARRGRPGDRPGDDPLGRGHEGNIGREEGSLRDAAAGPSGRGACWRSFAAASRTPTAQSTNATISNA